MGLNKGVLVLSMILCLVAGYVHCWLGQGTSVKESDYVTDFRTRPADHNKGRAKREDLQQKRDKTNEFVTKVVLLEKMIHEVKTTLPQDMNKLQKLQLELQNTESEFRKLSQDWAVSYNTYTDSLRKVKKMETEQQKNHDEELRRVNRNLEYAMWDLRKSRIAVSALAETLTRFGHTILYLNEQQAIVDFKPIHSYSAGITREREKNAVQHLTKEERKHLENLLLMLHKENVLPDLKQPIAKGAGFHSAIEMTANRHDPGIQNAMETLKGSIHHCLEIEELVKKPPKSVTISQQDVYKLEQIKNVLRKIGGDFDKIVRSPGFTGTYRPAVTLFNEINQRLEQSEPSREERNAPKIYIEEYKA